MGEIKMTEKLLNEVFEITRASDTTEPGRTINLATFMAQHNLSIQEIVDTVTQQNKTGWKEVVGNITKITGRGLEELRANVHRLKDFGKIDSDQCYSSKFDERVKKIRAEIKTAKENSARINFSTELNGVVPAIASGHH